MKRGNALSKAARLAKTRREQQEARKEREKHFPKPQLVPEIDQSKREEKNEPKDPQQASTLAAGRLTTRQQPHGLRWGMPALIPASSTGNVIFAFPGR